MVETSAISGHIEQLLKTNKIVIFQRKRNHEEFEDSTLMRPCQAQAYLELVDLFKIYKIKPGDWTVVNLDELNGQGDQYMVRLNRMSNNDVSLVRHRENLWHFE